MLGSTQVTQQLQVVTQAALSKSVHVQPVALFDANGAPVDLTGNPVAATTLVAGTVKKAAANADVATVNASDLATAITLVNVLKGSFNGLQGVLRTAGILT